MKKLSIFFLFMLFPLLAKSQDTVVLKDGRRVICDIINSDSTTVYLSVINKNKKVKTSIQKDEVESLKFYSSYRSKSFEPTKQSNTVARVYFYRLPTYVGSMLRMNILMNEQPVVSLKNNAIYQIDVEPANYTFSCRIREQAKVNLTLEAGKIYYISSYLQPDFLTPFPILAVVDSLTGKSIIDGGMLEHQQYEFFNTEKPKARIGLKLNAGGGFDNIGTGIANEDNYELTVSAGGGVGIGAELGYEITKYFDLSINGFFQRSSLSQNIENGSAYFDRYAILLTPAVIIPIKEIDFLRLFIGVGVGYYSGAEYAINASEMDRGKDSKYNYKPAIGYHFSWILNSTISDKYSLSLGLKYYNVNYNYIQEGNNANSKVYKILKPNGSGLDATMACYYHF